jgi:hypothetical protein
MHKTDPFAREGANYLLRGAQFWGLVLFLALAGLLASHNEGEVFEFETEVPSSCEGLIPLCAPDCHYLQEFVRCSGMALLQFLYPFLKFLDGESSSLHDVDLEYVTAFAHGQGNEYDRKHVLQFNQRFRQHELFMGGGRQLWVKWNLHVALQVVEGFGGSQPVERLKEFIDVFLLEGLVVFAWGVSGDF